MTSVELDYTENPALIVPSYTHQVRRTHGAAATSVLYRVLTANCRQHAATAMSTHVL